jgi:hypothetical protein
MTLFDDAAHRAVLIQVDAQIFMNFHDLIELRLLTYVSYPYCAQGERRGVIDMINEHMACSFTGVNVRTRVACLVVCDIHLIIRRSTLI